MRLFLLAYAVSLAGCLHAQTPTSRSTSYEGFMRSGDYVSAARVASRFRLGARFIDRPLQLQRKEVHEAVRAYAASKDRPDAHIWLSAAIVEMTDEIRIACRYGPTPEAARETVFFALVLKRYSHEYEVLYPVLDEGCPLDRQLRDEIIDAAILHGKADYAIRHCAAAGWDQEQLLRLLWHFFRVGDCADGMKALIALKLPVDVAVRVIETATCETVRLDLGEWMIPEETANAFFFAAVRGANVHLALELLPLGTLGEEGETFLFQEATRSGKEALIMRALTSNMSHHDAFMAYLWARGRHRFIANFSLTLDWQRKAFDKLIELRRWEDAAEAAQYGLSQSLRVDGVRIAFRAAMAAGDFAIGRYLLARYGPREDAPGIITQEMYDAEWEAWFAAKKAAKPLSDPAPEPAPKSKRKRPKPCPPDAWCP